MIKKYIITAHTNPEQLKRLICKLNDEYSIFYIHIDLKSDISEFKKVIDFNNVIFIENRIDCIWGDFSIVVATINLLKEASKSGDSDKDSKIIVLSGQDYPIKSLSDINNYLKANKEYEFISFELDPIPNDHERIKKYKINVSSKRGNFMLLNSFFNSNLKDKLRRIKYLIKKIISFDDFTNMLFDRKPLFQDNYKGSNWFCINEKTAVKILRYIDKNKTKLYNYYKYTFCADEHFFHTILKDMMKENKDIKIKPCLHFIDWNRKNIPWVLLPVTFTTIDLELLLKQPENKLFARKFDQDMDEEILNLLDENIG